MFEGILLEKEQEQLLIDLVEIVRSVPRDNRHKFIVSQTYGGTTLLLPNYPEHNRSVLIGDLETLARVGLLASSYSSRGTPNFDITPLGFRYYEYLKSRLGESVERIEKTVTGYLRAGDFQNKYPLAFQKWVSAEELLWKTNTGEQQTTIGHLCREAMQEFADTLIERYSLANVPSDKAKTVARIKAVLDKISNQLASTEKPFLEALLVYWGTVSDLVQRQEHGAQKEGQVLNWEDARRVVFHTAIVMFEIDRAV